MHKLWMYILVDGKPVEEPDPIKWGNWFGKIDERRIALDQVSPAIRVSTVFLGLDHSFGFGPPLFFETMVFGGSMDQEMNRYCTKEEALQGHAEMVRKVKANGLAKEV